MDRELFHHPAWEALNGTDKTVLGHFWCKRRPVKNKKTGEWYLLNNGEIMYTYDEAKRNGILASRFTRSLDNLIKYGWLDITRTGAGQVRTTTLYAMSERWRKWGTAEFQEAARPKKARWHDRIGFQKKPIGYGTL